MPAERRPLRAAPGDLSPSQEAPAALALHCQLWRQRGGGLPGHLRPQPEAFLGGV